MTKQDGKDAKQRFFHKLMLQLNVHREMLDVAYFTYNKKIGRHPEAWKASAIKAARNKVRELTQVSKLPQGDDLNNTITKGVIKKIQRNEKRQIDKVRDILEHRVTMTETQRQADIRACHKRLKDQLVDKYYVNLKNTDYYSRYAIGKNWVKNVHLQGIAICHDRLNNQNVFINDAIKINELTNTAKHYGVTQAWSVYTHDYRSGVVIKTHGGLLSFACGNNINEAMDCAAFNLNKIKD
jgi:hypothetical protein